MTTPTARRRAGSSTCFRPADRQQLRDRRPAIPRLQTPDARFQDYYTRNREGPFCDAYIEPKLALLAAKVAGLQSGCRAVAQIALESVHSWGVAQALRGIHGLATLHLDLAEVPERFEAATLIGLSRNDLRNGCISTAQLSAFCLGKA